VDHFPLFLLAKEQIEKSKDIQATDIFEQKCLESKVLPIHLAVSLGRKEIIMELVSLSSINSTDEDGNSPAMLAAKDGFNDIVMILVDEGKADIFIKNDRHETLLTKIAASGDWGLLDWLIKLSSRCRQNGFTLGELSDAVASACEGNAVHIVRYILRHMRGYMSLGTLGGCLNHFAPCIGEIPLLIATRKGNYEIAELLLSWGASANVIGDRGESALHSALQLPPRKMYKFVQLLFKHGALLDVYDSRRDCWLNHAIGIPLVSGALLRLSFIEVDRRKKSKLPGSQPNICLGQWTSPADLAFEPWIENESLDVLLQCVLRGWIDNGHWNIARFLHLVAKRPSSPILEAVSKLILQDKIDSCDYTGMTVLHHAAACGYEDSVDLLLEYGAQPFTKIANNKFSLQLDAQKFANAIAGSDAVQLAASNGHDQIVRNLREFQASPATYAAYLELWGRVGRPLNRRDLLKATLRKADLDVDRVYQWLLDHRPDIIRKQDQTKLDTEIETDDMIDFEELHALEGDIDDQGDTTEEGWEVISPEDLYGEVKMLQSLWQGCWQDNPHEAEKWQPVRLKLTSWHLRTPY
jgi:ankyrin repeat protein